MSAASKSPAYDPVGEHTLQVIAGARQFNTWMFRVIQPFINGRILEIGSGIGNISSLLLKDYPSVTLSDINPQYCSYLHEHYGHFTSLESIERLDLVAPDFEQRNANLLQQFDTIILMNVIEHIEDHDQAVNNAKRLLRTGGQLILLAPAYPYLFCKLDTGLGHFRRYTKKSLKALLTRNGFFISGHTYFNFTGIAGWFLFGKILRRTELNNGEVGIYEKTVPLHKFIDRLMHRFAGLSVICIGKKTG